jgi:hypothetical protein
VGSVFCGATSTGEAIISPAVWSKTFGLALALLCVETLVRGLRAGIVVGPTWVEVRGYFRRDRRVQWSDVARFTLTPSNPMNNTVNVAVVLNDGRYLSTFGISGRSPKDAKVLGILAKLESLRPEPA